MPDRSNRGKTLKGLSVQTLVTITLGILGVLYFAIMSRLLSKEDFGYFAIITAVTSILSSLSEAGLGSAVIQKKDADMDFVHTAWTLSLLLGLFFCCLLFICSGLLSDVMIDSDYLSRGYQIMSFSLVFYAINGVGKAVIIKKLQFLKYGIFDITAYTLSASIGVYLAFKNYGFYSVAIAMLLHQVILGILIAFNIRNSIWLSIKKQYAKQILTFGGWLTGSVIVRNITDQIDKLITTHWLPVSIIGAYNRPSGLIAQITGNLNGIFDTILFPILSGINDNSQKIVSAYQKSVNLIILYAIVLTSLFVLSSDVIISIFLGEKWLYLDSIFQLISLSILFLSYSRLADCFFRSLGIVKPYFYTRCSVLIFACVFIYFGCQFGILGLTVGYLFSRVADSVIKLVYLQPYITFKRFQFYKDILNTIMIPIVIFIICYVIKINLEYGGLLSTIVYIILMCLTVFFTPRSLGNVFYENIYMLIAGKNLFKCVFNRKS